MRGSRHSLVDFGGTTLLKNSTYFSLPIYIGDITKYSFIITYTTPAAAATDVTVYFQYSDDPSPINAKNGRPAQSGTVTGQFTPSCFTTPTVSAPTFSFTTGSATEQGAMIDNVETQTNWARAVLTVNSGSTAASITVVSAQFVGKSQGGS